MASAVSRATAPTRGKLPASPTAPVRPAPRPAPPRPHAGMLRSAPPAMRLGSAARSVGGGAPLPDAVRPALENGFGVDLEPVRVHTDTRAQSAARNLSARAFAFGPDIFLGSGERPVDLRLMAHESAHVLQQQRMTAVQPWSPFGTNRYEAEANRASSAVASGGRFTVFEQLAGPRVQRAESGKTLNYLADQANLIPGFRLFTIILGANPINDQRVNRSAANILRAMFEFLPGGTLISEALANNGVFDKVGAWVEQQLQSLGLVGGQIKAAVAAFIDSLGVKDLFDLGGAWSRAKRIFSEPVDRILNFVKGLVTGIVKFIKEAILLPLASLAQKTRGWDLLIAVLGRNPITDEVVPQTAENLIGGFMKLIGEEEVWENMKKANAIGRAWAWFQGALATVVGFVRMVPQLFLAALASLEVADIVLVPRAYVKVGLVFAGFAVQFVTWAGEAVWRLLEIIFESVKPGALDYIKKTGGALKSILKNPLPFVGNLVKAAKLGFTNFADHFGTHLKAGLIDWLTGSLPGVYIPKGFTLVEIVKFALSMLGISWANIRGKLVKVVGDPAVTAMETGFTIVKKLVTEGPAAAWAEIKDQLSGLKDQVIDGIISMVVEMIAMKAIPKLIAMFIPGAGFLSAIISIYDTIVVFVERIKKIVEVVTSFVDSIVAIAGGAIGAAANRVERALAGLVSLAIGFLAGFAGLGKVSDKVMGVIQKVRGTVDKGIDALIAWIVKMAKKVGRFIAQAGVPQDPNERLRLAGKSAIAASRRLTGRLSLSLLEPALLAIRTRYGLTEIGPYKRDGKWYVKVSINPFQIFDLPEQADLNEGSVEIAVVSTRQPRPSVIHPATIPRLRTNTMPLHFEVVTTRAVAEAAHRTVEPNARFGTETNSVGVLTRQVPAGFREGSGGLLLPTQPRLFGSLSTRDVVRNREEPHLDFMGMQRQPDALLITPHQIEPLEFTLDVTLSKKGKGQTTGATPHKLMQIPGTVDLLLRHFPLNTPIVYTVFTHGAVPQIRIKQLDDILRRQNGNPDVTVHFVRR